MQLMAGAWHGGAENFFERLAVGLQGAGVTQRLVIRHAPERAARFRAAGLETLELPFGGPLDFRTRPALRRAISDFKPPVVLSWMNRATRLCPRGDFVHVARLGGYYNLKYYKHCDHLICNTRGIENYVRAAGWPVERVHYLPNFVTGDNRTPLPRSSLATPDDAPLVVALGRLHPNKGFDVLLAALARAPRFYLWLAGDGPQRAKLEAQARKLGLESRVRFLGWREDSPALLAAADLFVCPSRIEPLGNVVIEAWAMGTPVIATDAAGPRELIEDGENGVLVPIENADLLAHAMQNLIDDADRRAHFKLSGRAAYEAEFTQPRVVALYREFLEKVAR
jgi:glycosyltransferase involved in cell wall biosynthesis